tara:strand:+ start:177 stop:467 length:291 start_codon:yes stop_codon:yes gene_type:complete
MALSSDEKKQRRAKDRGRAGNELGYFANSVTKSDSSNLDSKRAQLFIGTGGNIKVDLAGGSTVILKNIPSGTYLRGIYINKVYGKGTTASDIVAIY